MPFAHEWHLKDRLIPLEILQEMGELGVFGLTIPEEYGGFGMSRVSPCAARQGFPAAISWWAAFGTRSEIAAELILGGGTEEQKQEWLPKIALAQILPCARSSPAQHRLRPRARSAPGRCATATTGW